MAKDVFISYSNHDKVIADKVCKILEQVGIDCWIAPRDIPPGAEFDVAIVDGIDQCQAIVVVLTPEANASVYVKNEVNRAFSRGKAILTFRVEDIKPERALEFYLARHQWTDGFPPPVEERIVRTGKALLELLGRPPGGPRLTADTAPAKKVSGNLSIAKKADVAADGILSETLQVLDQRRNEEIQREQKKRLRQLLDELCHAHLLVEADERAAQRYKPLSAAIVWFAVACYVIAAPTVFVWWWSDTFVWHWAMLGGLCPGLVFLFLSWVGYATYLDWLADWKGLHRIVDSLVREWPDDFVNKELLYDRSAAEELRRSVVERWFPEGN